MFWWMTLCKRRHFVKNLFCFHSSLLRIFYCFNWDSFNQNTKICWMKDFGSIPLLDSFKYLLLISPFWVGSKCLNIYLEQALNNVRHMLNVRFEFIFVVFNIFHVEKISISILNVANKTYFSISKWCDLEIKSSRSRLDLHRSTLNQFILGQNVDEKNI